MSSRSAAFRPAAFDTVVIVGLWVATYIASKLLRNYFPAPEHDTWRWVCAIMGAAVAFGVSAKFRLPVMTWMAVFSVTYLICQILGQTLFAFGVLRI